MNSLEGKIALITGAKGGLGTFVTESFLAAGARVIGVSRSIQASDFSHPQFLAMPAELSGGEAARKLAEDVVARFGRIDALVHVMGGFAGGTRVDETDDATFEKMLDLNYRAAFFITRAVLPQMRQQGSGRILAVASRQAVEPAAMVGAYSASKAALVSLIGRSPWRTKTAASPQIRCCRARWIRQAIAPAIPRRTARSGCSRRR
jgi:NAD(P)-dependent dehydrogenase (short-subunit alcohol dehydrogenase family)